MKFGFYSCVSVLDVGAAPGAWTEFLSKHVYHVVAVDPGKLENSILGEKVTHICKKVWNTSVLWKFSKISLNFTKSLKSLKFLKYPSFSKILKIFPLSLSLSIYMHACMHACMCVCMYVCMYACIHILGLYLVVTRVFASHAACTQVQISLSELVYEMLTHNVRFEHMI